MARSYVLKVDRSINGTLYAVAGAKVYGCKGWDYGCANDDTRWLGFEHVSVTLDPDGDYPFFTVPVRDLAPAPPATPDALMEEEKGSANKELGGLADTSARLGSTNQEGGQS